MKKAILLFLIALLICGLAGCKGASDPDSQSVTTAADVVIDYGDSVLYSKEDMDAAIQVIRNEFDQWKGFTMQSVTFGTDAECNEKNLKWLNELEAANDAKEEFTRCILFETDFHTAKDCDNGFESDRDYQHFQWWLGREDNGGWKLVTWGY